VLLALRRQAESSGDETSQGVRLHGSALDIAREGGVDAAQVRDVLARLTRMRIVTEDEAGAIVVTDLPRLMEFMEFLELPRKVEG
jgi:DNA-binding GntR family transcriptional regulator